MSSVPKHTAWHLASSSTACSIEVSKLWLSSVFVIESASGGPAASRSAHSSTNASSSVSGSTRFTKPRSRVGRRDEVAEEGKLLRSLHADEAREEPRTAKVDDESSLGEDLREAGVLGRNHEIAGQGHVGAGSRGDTSHLRDGRLGDAVERECHRTDAAHRHEPVNIRTIHGGEVGSGAERASFTGEHQHPVVGSRPDLPEHLEELERHLRVDRVAFLRTIEGDGHHSFIALAAFHQDRLHRGEATPVIAVP